MPRALSARARAGCRAGRGAYSADREGSKRSSARQGRTMPLSSQPLVTWVTSPGPLQGGLGRERTARGKGDGGERGGAMARWRQSTKQMFGCEGGSGPLLASAPHGCVGTGRLGRGGGDRGDPGVR